jgi:hypothetical protein
MTIAVCRQLLLALLAGACSAVAAQVAPPNWNEDLSGEGTLSKQPVVGIYLGSSYVKLEETTLSDVRRKAGVGTIAQRGQDGTRVSYLCFTDDVSPLKARLWLISSVMGGSDLAVVELNAIAIGNDDKSTGACPRLPKHLRPVMLDRGIWLGTSEESLKKRLGEPSIRQEGWIAFNFFGKLPGPYHGKIVNWDAISVLSVELSAGRVAALRANRMTSY